MQADDSTKVIAAQLVFIGQQLTEMKTDIGSDMADIKANFNRHYEEDRRFQGEQYRSMERMGERLATVEGQMSTRTAGGALGILAALGAAVVAWLQGTNGKPHP